MAEILSLQHHDTDCQEASSHTAQHKLATPTTDAPSELSHEQGQLKGTSTSHFLKTSTLPDTKNIEVQLDSNQRILFQKGQPIILKGRSGTGKSHLTRCLTRDTQCERTVIRLGDTEINTLHYQSWRDSVHRIDKNSSFVEGSLIDNLTCFRPVLNGAAFTLCKGLSIKNEIDALESGFYTQLKGNNTIPLSRQVQYALLIIRAMLCQKNVLVLDDIDSVYDQEFATRVVSMLVPKATSQFLIIISNKINHEALGVKSIKLTKEFAS
ncbi:ATP-binding cassette domain-containing protein [Vibrio cionasavignyae]